MKNKYLLLIGFIVLLSISVGIIYLQTLVTFKNNKDNNRVEKNIGPSQDVLPQDIRVDNKKVILFYNELKDAFSQIQWSEASEKEYSDYQYFDDATQQSEPYNILVGYEIQMDTANWQSIADISNFFDEKLKFEGWHENFAADKAGGGYGSSIFGYGKDEQQFIFHEETFCFFDEDTGVPDEECNYTMKVFYGRKNKK